MKHFRLGFSDSDKWMTCGVYCDMVADVGDDSSPSIDFGNKSHKILEDKLNGIAIQKTSINEGEYDCAMVAFDYVLKTLVERPGDTYAELTCQITSSGREDLGGTGDVFLWDGKVLEYIDLKTGAGTYVSAGSSSQLKLNAIAFCESMNIKPEKIILTIVQPRWYGDEESIRSIELTHGELTDWLRVAVMPAVDRQDDPEAVGTVTDKCVQCKGRHVCKYRDAAVAKGITIEAEIETTMAITEKAIFESQDATVYDNVRLGQVLSLVPVIKDYCNSLQKHAQEIIMKGEEVPGFKVVQTSGNPTWVGDEEELLDKLNKSTIKESSYMKATLRTPKQVAALKVGPKSDKPMSKAIAKVIADHTGRTAGGLALVNDNDPRESAAPSFKNVPLPIPDFLL